MRDMSFVLFGVSLISWEQSSAHFNLGITIANVFVDLNDFWLNFTKSILIVLTQLSAAAAAMGVSRY